MISINNNLSSFIAQNSLNTSTNKLNETIERMSSGYKINHAKDNAANYSISTNMTTKIGAYKVAEDNASMGLDMVTTASETLSEMQNHATRLRALATQARNGTYGAQSLEAIQQEANSIITEIDRLYNTAKFNGISLFNQTEYDVPDNMPKADPVTGFIENPYDYSEEDLENITSISEVKNNTFTENIYKIETAEELSKLAKLTNDGVDTTGKTFVLAKDIDLKEYCEKYKDDGGWTPIGNETNRFKGTFNGNGNIISNLTINRPNADCQGLFGYCDSGYKILNIGVENISIIGKGSVGGLIGRARSGGSKVFNSFATGHIKSNYEYAGGLIGYSETAYVDSCYSEVNIQGCNFVGGLFGSSFYGIKNCYSLGKVKGVNNVGGLAGRFFTPSLLNTTENCYSKTKVVGDANVGGLFGWVKRTGANPSLKLNNVHSFSNVSGNTNVGSFVGGLENCENSLFTSITFKDCFVASQELPKIAATYQTDGSFVDYDLSILNESLKEVILNDITTTLQVGIKDENSSQLNFNTHFEYNLCKIIHRGITSNSTLFMIDEFINLLSSKQTELGSVSNRLGSVLDEISTQYDNLVSSRSTLRDADMAELSSTYIQQQILQEASATLMATANQSPAIALQLI